MSMPLRRPLAATLLLVATPAFADDRGTWPEDAEPPQIVVTGTRIRTTEPAPLEPIATLDGEYLRDRNLTNLADALNAMPGFLDSITPDGVQDSFGQGANFVNAFGLGTNRTLTLLNGRRVVSSNVPTIFALAPAGTQVDLNMIPAILVDRVERVATGGAPVYGSDAIAGTVNVITRSDLRGLELSATGGITDHGDNFRSNLSGAWGSQFGGGRGRLTLALSHDKVRGVRQSARRFYRDNVMDVPNTGLPGTDPATDGRLNPKIGYDTGPDDGIPATVLIRDGTIPFLTGGGLVFGGAIFGQYRFDPSGNLVPFRNGSRFGPFQSGGDGFRFSDYGQITSDLARTTAWLSGEYELNDRLRLFGEAQVFHSRADEIVDQPDYNALLFSGVSGPLLFSAFNPLLSPQAQGVLLANGAPLFVLSRANADLGDPTGYARSHLYRGVLGLAGDVAIGGRRFDFEVSATYGRTDFTDHDQQIDQQRFVNAINVRRDPAGAIVCDAAPLFPTGGTPVADPDCRPLDLFGEGRRSREALDYILADVKAKSRLEQFVVNANIGGSPFEMFGNAVSVNAGFEHRSEKARFTPDAFLRAGLGRSVAVPPVRGGYHLDELFGEVLVPLIAPENDGFVHRLELFGRARHSHNSINGGFTAWSAGGRVQPVRAVELRGNFTRSFRSPAVAELFSPQATTREIVPDLCSPAEISSGPNPAIRSRNCGAFLAAFPGATPLIASFITVPALQGGNRDLANERADSFTFGATLRPAFAPGLTVSADYIDIRIHDPIELLGIAQVASACFDNPEFDLSDPANGNAYCSAIGRNAAGQVPSDPLDPAVRTGFVNGKRIAFSGIQGSLAYATGLEAIGAPGAVSIAGDLFYVRRFVRDITGIEPVRLDGLIGDAKVRGQLRMAYRGKGWGVGSFINYTGRQLFSRFDRGPSPNDAREIDHLRPYVTVDANLHAQPIEGLRLNFAVTNLFDRQGQRYFGTLVPQSIHDPLGRRFSLSVAKAF